MKGLMKVLGSPSLSSKSLKPAEGSYEDTDLDTKEAPQDMSPDQNEAVHSLALDCASALKSGDTEGFADSLVAMIEMVR